MDKKRTRATSAAILLAFALGACDDGSSCEEAGRTYEDGESWPCSDGCNSCSCKDGMVLSTLIGCDPDAGN